ncbi:hypothetical protein NMG60_11030780 [Bertholletia excelsa]
MSSQQTPPLLYPNLATGRPSPSPPFSSSHSDGSFGTVFIVLAVILVVSMAACFIGRLCNRRHHHSHQLPAEPQRAGDVESGLGKGTPATKKVSFANGGGPSESKPDNNGQNGGEARSGHEEGLKAGQ